MASRVWFFGHLSLTGRIVLNGMADLLTGRREVAQQAAIAGDVVPDCRIGRVKTDGRKVGSSGLMKVSFHPVRPRPEEPPSWILPVEKFALAGVLAEWLLAPVTLYLIDSTRVFLVARVVRRNCFISSPNSSHQHLNTEHARLLRTLVRDFHAGANRCRFVVFE